MKRATMQEVIDQMVYDIEIPWVRHGSLIYGGHWKEDGGGRSGHRVKFRGYWFSCAERPDLEWATTPVNEWPHAVTLQDVRDELRDVLERAQEIRRML
jgi:hypothetical protein